jgi:AcrR family transcriptional regulator
VAQPYVFSLFGSKRELFLAAVHRGFQYIEELFTRAAAEYDPAIALPDATVRTALGHAYVEMLESDRDHLMLQHQAYAACEDEVIRDAVRRDYAHLVAHVQELTGADDEEIDDFMRYGMWLNVAAAMGVEDLSVGCEWVRDELAGTSAEGSAGS